MTAKFVSAEHAAEITNAVSTALDYVTANPVHGVALMIAALAAPMFLGFNGVGPTIKGSYLR
jgi:hypothetical protein